MGSAEKISKAELLLLNCTQFPSLGIFVSKKSRKSKKLRPLVLISFKSCILGGPSFVQFPTFLVIKIHREGN